MLTFEKVLEIFEDYLAQDMELEVYKSRYGYVCVPEGRLLQEIPRGT